MDKSAKAAWNFAAKGKRRRDDVTGEMYALQGRQLYISQASKLAQVSPGASLNILPPMVPFAGDTITVQIEQEDAGFTFEASGANAADATTELLLQRLPSLDRAPSPDDYVSEGFHRFTSGSGSYHVECGVGVWSAAYRFVNPLMGEESDLVELGTNVVSLAVVRGGMAEGAKPATKAAPVGRAKKAA